VKKIKGMFFSELALSFLLLVVMVYTKGFLFRKCCMAFYSYQCPACGNGFTLQQAASTLKSQALTFCPSCWQPAKRAWDKDLPTVQVKTKKPELTEVKEQKAITVEAQDATDNKENNAVKNNLPK